MQLEYVREPQRNTERVLLGPRICVAGWSASPDSTPGSPSLDALQRRRYGTPELSSREDLRAFRPSEPWLDLVEVTSALTLGALPGLEPPACSRLRHTVHRLLEAPARIRVALLGKRPEKGDPSPDTFSHLGHALSDAPGSLLLFPDLGLPFELALGTGEAHRRLRVAARGALLDWTGKARALQTLLQEHYCTALLDVPQPSVEAIMAFCLSPEWSGCQAWQAGALLEQVFAEELEVALNRLGELDAGLFLWTGELASLRSFAWSSASAPGALVLLAEQGSEASAVLDRRPASLGEARYSPLDRRSELLPHLTPRFDLPAHLRSRVIQTRLEAGSAWFEGHTCLRAPAGTWKLPALRVLKRIELEIRRAADSFVFRPADDTEALDLARAIEFSLLPHLETGVLTPLSMEQPLAFAWAEPLEGPALVARIEGRLQPWMLEFRLRLAVRGGEILLNRGGGV